MSPHDDVSAVAGAGVVAAGAEAAVLLLLLLLLPQALTTTARPAASRTTSAAVHLLLNPLTASPPPLGVDGTSDFALGACPVRQAEQARGVVLQDQWPHLGIDLEALEVTQPAVGLDHREVRSEQDLV